VFDSLLDVRANAIKSPKVEGIIEGSKAAILAAPLAAAVQAIRGRSPTLGAIGGGVVAGSLVGLIAAGIQKYRNMRAESEMQYHIDNIYQPRNPMMMDENIVMQKPSFTQGFENVRNPYQTPY
jgi:hypothetical protein